MESLAEQAHRMLGKRRHAFVAGMPSGLGVMVGAAIRTKGNHIVLGDLLILPERWEPLKFLDWLQKLG